jgi:hypothetical protein
MQTPSTHRQRLAPGNDPTSQPGFVNLHSTGIARTPMLPPQRISPRQPLSNLSGNNSGPTGFAGYGMSAGLKVSNPTGAGTHGLARPVMRSRGPAVNPVSHRILLTSWQLLSDLAPDRPTLIRHLVLHLHPICSRMETAITNLQMRHH